LEVTTDKIAVVVNTVNDEILPADLAMSSETNLCLYSAYLATRLFLADHFEGWEDHEIQVMLKNCRLVRPDWHKREKKGPSWTHVLEAPAILLSGTVMMAGDGVGKDFKEDMAEFKRCDTDAKANEGIVFLNRPMSSTQASAVAAPGDIGSWRYVKKTYHLVSDDHTEPPRLLVLSPKVSLVWERRQNRDSSTRRLLPSRQSMYFPWKINDSQADVMNGLAFAEATPSQIQRWEKESVKRAGKKGKKTAAEETKSAVSDETGSGSAPRPARAAPVAIDSGVSVTAKPLAASMPSLNAPTTSGVQNPLSEEIGF